MWIMSNKRFREVYVPTGWLVRAPYALCTMDLTALCCTGLQIGIQLEQGTRVCMRRWRTCFEKRITASPPSSELHLWVKPTHLRCLWGPGWWQELQQQNPHCFHAALTGAGWLKVRAKVSLIFSAHDLLDPCYIPHYLPIFQLESCFI